MLIRADYTTAADFYAAAAGPSDWPADKRRADVRDATRTEWAGSESLPAALATARAGWIEGTRAFDEALQGLVEHQQRGRWKRTGYDRAGDELDTDRLFARDPEPWAVYTKTTRAKRVHSILVCGSYSYDIGEPEAREYFAGLAALVAGIEAGGDSVAITLGFGVTKNALGIRTRVALKAAGEPLTALALAFALCHPAMLRRVWFAWAETTVPWTVAHAEGLSPGYGIPRDCSDLTFPGEYLTPRLTGSALADMRRDGAVDYWSSWWRTMAAQSAAA